MGIDAFDVSVRIAYLCREDVLSFKLKIRLMFDEVVLDALSTLKICVDVVMGW